MALRSVEEVLNELVLHLLAVGEVAPGLRVMSSSSCSPYPSRLYRDDFDLHHLSSGDGKARRAGTPTRVL